MTNIDELLDDRLTGQGDFPDWWDPEEEGEQLQGVVTARRDNPWAEEGEEDPKQMLWVQTEGQEWSTRVHTILSNLIKEQDVHVGDYVRIVYQGERTTDGGRNAKNYQLAVVRKDEIEESDIEIPEADGGMVATAPTVEDKAVEFVENLMEAQGVMDEEDLDRYLNDVNSYDVTPETVVEQTEYTLENGVIR